jgi:aprataxin
MAGELKNDLIFAMNDPTVRLYSDEFVTIIADKFPKSKHHYLVLPHEDISDVRDIKEHHIPKLIYMELIGLEFAMAHTNLPAHGFLVGYHAYPSMKRLHLHILSNDFNSPHLKESYQWNLFHTEFFINTHKLLGDGVAVRTTASVLTRTIIGSILGHGLHLTLGRQLSKQRGCHPPN